MSFKTAFTAGLLGCSLCMASLPAAHSETLRVMNGSASTALNVPMNRAVVVESDQPFAELSIANPGIADISTLSDRSIYVLGKAPGRTTLTLLGPDGKLITNVDVQVTPDVAEFKERLKQILPNEKVEVRTANDGIVISGTVSSTAKLDRALDLAERYAPGRVSNLMNVGGEQQVMLKVRFAEMAREVSKELNGSIGIVNGSPAKARLGAGNLDGINSVLSGQTLTTEKAGVLGIKTNIGSLQLGVMLEALEGKGLVRTLAEPNLTALSGQEASFLAGGEYPIPVAQASSDGGAGTVTIEYKPFGVGLNFTPTVVDEDIINLQIDASVSSLDGAAGITQNGFDVKAFKTRRTQTTVEMRDGESFAIAGLLQDDFRDLNNQVPWLGDIPVLGALFRSTSYQRSQTELVIIVTPHLVSPTRGEAFALPTDRVRLPSEAELFLFGKTAGGGKKAKGAAGEVAKQDFSGSYGYVME